MSYFTMRRSDDFSDGWDHTSSTSSSAATSPGLPDLGDPMALDSMALTDHLLPYESSPMFGTMDPMQSHTTYGTAAPLQLSQFETDDFSYIDPLSDFMGESSPPMNNLSSAVDDEVTERPGKPRCWDHGCNGREFSSKSNFMRHIKERSGASAKCTCPLCGAIFTRNSARDTHLAKQSCNRIRRYSNGRPRPSRLALLGNPGLATTSPPASSHNQMPDWNSVFDNNPGGSNAGTPWG